MLIKMQRKQFKVARGKPRIQPTPKKRNNKRSIFDTTNESTIMEQGDTVGSINFSGLELAPKRTPVVVSAKELEKKFPGRTTIYNRYIQRLMKHIFPKKDRSVSTSGKTTLNDFSNQMFELIAELAGEMVKTNHRRTIRDWDIQSATRIVLPPELAAHAHGFALEKMKNLRQSRSL